MQTPDRKIRKDMYEAAVRALMLLEEELSSTMAELERDTEWRRKDQLGFNLDVYEAIAVRRQQRVVARAAATKRRNSRQPRLRAQALQAEGRPDFLATVALGSRMYDILYRQLGNAVPVSYPSASPGTTGSGHGQLQELDHSLVGRIDAAPHHLQGSPRAGYYGKEETDRISDDDDDDDAALVAAAQLYEFQPVLGVTKHGSYYIGDALDRQSGRIIRSAWPEKMPMAFKATVSVIDGRADDRPHRRLPDGK